MTFVASLRYNRIEAPWLIDGPINCEGFRADVEKVVAATGELLGASTAHECANYFANAGYGQA